MQDLDGDTGLSSSMDIAAVTWVWKNGTVALTAAQLAAPFSTNFLGKTLTVSASVPVSVSSLTGAPITQGPQPLSSATYLLVVPESPPVVRVNGYSFAMDAGFPQTGFVGATFQFWMDGTSAAGNSNYTFSADPLVPWVTITPATGVVTFTNGPAAAQTVNIQITDTRTGTSTTYPITLNTWFVNNGLSNQQNPSLGVAYCNGLAGGYSVPSLSNVTTMVIGASNATRGAIGRVWSEWGDMTIYGNGWFKSPPGNDAVNYWTKDAGAAVGIPYRVSVGNGARWGYSSNSYATFMCMKSVSA
ncbi:hypothetical protein OQA87_22325 [Yersinia intermedia]|uniref:hypothetical protein n=1 Tax=Yersinia intermedia TaxID=631 RepID=UPI00124A7656|nr:hypothetical protein [Yersinia intermedia]MCW8114265.1 hypothetical protein [Yersinia intermedia]